MIGIESICCFKWRPKEGYRSTYSGETVNILFRMCRRHYPDPFRFICVTDDPAGIDPAVEIVPLWNDHAELEHPSNYLYPSCYRRLKAFAPEMGKVFGKRFVMLDLDCVIVDDMRPVWNRGEDFVVWGGQTSHPKSINGSMILMNAGCRPQVWTDFNPLYSPQNAKNAGFYGSDQAWIGYCLSGRDEARWTKQDGVFSYRTDVKRLNGALPKGARMVIFNGKKDPWSREVKGLPWIGEFYR